MLMLVASIGAYATLGEGKAAKTSILPGGKPLLSGKTSLKPGVFTLKSGYNFRGSEVINTTTEKKVIRINTTVAVQKGNTTFYVPIKKNILFDKLKVDIGNRQFQKH